MAEVEAGTSLVKHPVPYAPAPWKTKSECYWLFVTLRKLPAGVYDALEAGLEKDTGEFKGGLGVIMVVRYANTPVGTYDELILIPGNYAVPQPSASGPPKIPKKALRITRIYVSQRTTAYNGRVNWNIPKHLARFSFSAPPTPAGSSPPESLTVKVFAPSTADGDGAQPFFSVTLKPWRWVPPIAFSSKWLPVSTTQAQPPIPAAPGFGLQAAGVEREATERDSYDINPSFQDELLAGTDRWCSFPIESYVPRARGCWVTLHEPGKDEDVIKEASKYWPQDVQPWGIGAWCEDAELNIPAPIEWKL
ncbi:hypothetical protein BCR34DRAFT_599389 [Clohesyomyces aquaticus]|uniref:Uncharacterized protein n=1 Tax=Clohesyomyces aquaticus TaxID=1231657 RepID=A0A1Y1ZVC8_9PLEO|nr:hypothetical protein BCR34DRAFT_599389 [Clohesyomyces aquaticus]